MAEMQPFLISEFKTGIFNYLEPWVRPQDAFDPLENAYIYRGQIQKRSGYSVFGRMTYQDTIVNGNGGAAYGGTLQTIPISPGSFHPTNGTESFTDNGLGTLTGSAGGTGSINYTTGVWSLNFNAAVASGVLITASYIPQTMVGRPIMGIKTWTNEVTGLQTLIVCDTRRAMVYNTVSSTFVPLNSFSQTLASNGTTTAITFNTGFVASAPYASSLSPFSVSITSGVDVINDNGAGVFLHNGNALPDGTNFNAATVNYSTGVISITYAVAPATTVQTVITATLTGDYFTGNFSKFFNSTNWNELLYLTNNSDPITVYDGSTFPGTLSRPPFSITLANVGTFTNNIGSCLDVDIYKNRLIVQYPTVINAGTAQNGPYPQSFFWSQQNVPTNLAADVSGNGGALEAATSDSIASSEFLRDQMIVFFKNTTWIFRYTNNDFSPFRWDQVNNTKSTNAPYGTIAYDERVTAMGSKGLIACDGVNVQRYDISIIDQFITINQEFFGQCFGQRFDTLNQSWMLFPSDKSISGRSDSALIYNFLENSWAIYKMPMSCLGLYYVTTDATWSDFAVGAELGTIYPTWASAQIPWDNYLLQQLAPNLLGGDFNGYVYVMNDGIVDKPQGVSTDIPVDIKSARWNPFTQVGQKIQFGWLDFYYTIDPLNPTGTLQLYFYANNSSVVVAQKTLTLDGSATSDVAWKRIYINCIGEFLQMELQSSSPTNFKILGMILWCKPSGRLTP